MNGFRKIAVIVLTLAAWPANAAMTGWQDIGGGQARLVAIADPASKKVFAALEIELKEGWKTYWRQPGGSGIPPQFDFSRSRNFKAGEVRLPAPQILKAGDSHFAGYRKNAAFYFEGQSLDAEGAIRLDLFAGVCEEICIPAQASFEIAFSDLNTSDPRGEILVAMARDALPGAPRQGFSVTKARRNSDGSMEVEVELPQGGEPQLFVEGPQDWYFPRAELLSAEGGKAVFKVGSPQKPANAGEPGPLRFTLTNGNGAVEQRLSPGG